MISVLLYNIIIPPVLQVITTTTELPPAYNNITNLFLHNINIILNYFNTNISKSILY